MNILPAVFLGLRALSAGPGFDALLILLLGCSYSTSTCQLVGHIEWSLGLWILGFKSKVIIYMTLARFVGLSFFLCKVEINIRTYPHRVIIRIK